MTSRRGQPARSAIAMILLITQLSGCFHYVPAPAGALRPGAVVSFGLTDQGRIALTEPVGPGVLQLGGKLIAADDSVVVVAVNRVEYLDVEVPVRWSGERVVVARQHITNVQERQLSKRRTWLMAAVAVVGAALLSTLAITGFGSDVDDSGGGDDTDQ